ncbi:hypothetical protein [Amycolatopsis australiensis]|uniref:hypothetical protein n=1 Tax=Amycolatopsis australiensis TaxID=546364 RepID=UPI0015A6C69B|nr:hypothetical protein [Amycolatopsis australiensis]
MTPGRYTGTWRPGDGVRDAAARAAYTWVASVRASGGLPVVLGGDCLERTFR